MKKIFLIVAVSAILVSCGNNASTNHHDNMHSGDSMTAHDHAAMENIKTMSAQFQDVDPVVAGFVKGMLQDYMGIKNALVADQETDAAKSAGHMHTLMQQFDKSLLTDAQKKVYEALEEDLAEQAEHISENNAIDHKRSHFAMMSDDMYGMVKAFGSGQVLYHDHCPMARDNKGAMWLSETKDIRNPYFGNKMMQCGSVEEIIQ